MNSARMQFVILGLAIILGILVLIQSTNYVTAQGGNGNVTGAKFVCIQGAQSGSVSEVNATTSTLELNDVSDKTIIIDRGSDRPDRIVESANTTDFIGNWSGLTPVPGLRAPNAVLILDDVEQRDLSSAFLLFNPEYDPEANTLKYDITAENATTSINLPGEFGQSDLVIGFGDQSFIAHPISPDGR